MNGVKDSFATLFEVGTGAIKETQGAVAQASETAQEVKTAAVAYGTLTVVLQTITALSALALALKAWQRTETTKRRR